LSLDRLQLFSYTIRQRASSTVSTPKGLESRTHALIIYINKHLPTNGHCLHIAAPSLVHFNKSSTHNSAVSHRNVLAPRPPATLLIHYQATCFVNCAHSKRVRKQDACTHCLHKQTLANQRALTTHSSTLPCKLQHTQMLFRRPAPAKAASSQQKTKTSDHTNARHSEK
jgi:hypothetical protein